MESSAHISKLEQANSRRNSFLFNWARWIVAILLITAILKPFISNDRPLISHDGQGWSSPVINEILIDLGWKDEDKFGKYFSNYNKAIWPPIRFKDNNINSKDGSYLPPFSSSEKGWHFLGTDQLGRDVSAGMINGCVIATKVGFFSILLALFLGLLLGVPAGYLGNNRWYANFIQIAAVISFFILSTYYIIVELGYYSTSPFIIGLILLVLFAVFCLLYNFFGRLRLKKYLIPIDLILMKMIEVRKSIPSLFLVLAIVSLFANASVWNIVFIAGLLWGVDFARFIRAEVMNIINESYIQSIQAIGARWWRIILNHILPNAFPTLYTVFAFSISGAILMEASLSFLNIGIPIDEVTWGSLLSEARKHPSAWWLALFPGLAIFLVITALNIIGDKLARLKS